MNKIDIDEIKRWSKNEGHLKKFKIFIEQLKKNSN